MRSDRHPCYGERLPPRVGWFGLGVKIMGSVRLGLAAPSGRVVPPVCLWVRCHGVRRFPPIVFGMLVSEVISSASIERWQVGMR